MSSRQIVVELKTNKTCADTKQGAFDSHPSYYLRPSGVPGICLLPLKDMMGTIWLVNFKSGALYSALVKLDYRCYL